MVSKGVLVFVEVGSHGPPPLAWSGSGSSTETGTEPDPSPRETSYGWLRFGERGHDPTPDQSGSHRYAHALPGLITTYAVDTLWVLAAQAHHLHANRRPFKKHGPRLRGRGGQGRQSHLRPGIRAIACRLIGSFHNVPRCQTLNRLPDRKRPKAPENCCRSSSVCGLPDARSGWGRNGRKTDPPGSHRSGSGSGGAIPCNHQGLG